VAYAVVSPAVPEIVTLEVLTAIVTGFAYIVSVATQIGAETRQVHPRSEEVPLAILCVSRLLRDLSWR